MPMKKLFLLVVVCCAMMAHATTYSYLEFTNKAGTKTAFAVTNLTLNVNADELQVSNADGSVGFLLTELACMQFTVDKTATALENVLDADAAVQVYSVSGTYLGTYGSLVEATQMLQAGSYVISNGKLSQTIVVKN